MEFTLALEFTFSSQQEKEKRRFKAMEMTLNNGFCEMTQDESMTTEGGIGFIAGCVIGAVGAWVVDGTVEAFTGKNVSGWIAHGINKVRGK